jgi:serine/threonine protein kinase
MLSGGAYNSLADVWALGCVLFEMLALKPAFSGLSVTNRTRSSGSIDDSMHNERDVHNVHNNVHSGEVTIADLQKEILMCNHAAMPVNADPELVAVVKKMLVYPAERPSVTELLAMPAVARHLEEWQRKAR